MKDLLITLPVQAIAFALFLLFCAVSVAARYLVLWRASEEGGKDLAEEAVHLLTGLAATFAFFVGFAINVTWSGVSAGQVAVEQHAAALKQMSWSIEDIADRAEATALMNKLHAYASKAAEDDRVDLARGDVANLPSEEALHRFSDAVHAYAFRQPDGPEVAGLLREAAAVSGTATHVTAVAQRNPPKMLIALLLVSGAIVAGVMGITTVASRFPALMVVWCLIPALSISVVIALVFPFARPIGVDLEPIGTVAHQLVLR